jgi:membrane-associated phospholipid phosphatase
MNRILWAFCAATALAGLMIFVDEPVSRAIDHWISRDVQEYASRFSKNGTLLYYAVFGGLYGYARIKRQRRIEVHCHAYLKAQLIFSFALVRVLKIGVGRMRPGTEPDFDFFSMDSRYNSFPSGHAADIFVGATILYALLKQTAFHQWRHVPILYATLVAVGRVAGGPHYLADVLGGVLIGICGALFFLSRKPDGVVIRKQVGPAAGQR